MSMTQPCYYYYYSRDGQQGSWSHLWTWQASDHSDSKRFGISLGMVMVMLCFALGGSVIRVDEATRVSIGFSFPPNGGHLLANRRFLDPRSVGGVHHVIRWTSYSIYDVGCTTTSPTKMKTEMHARGGSLRNAQTHRDKGAPIPFSTTTPPTENTSSPTDAAAKLDALIQAIDKGGQNILYFAYGANMDPSVLTGKRGVMPLASLPAQAIAFADTGNGKRPRSSNRDGGVIHPGMCLCFCHRAGRCKHECLQRASLKFSLQATETFPV